MKTDNPEIRLARLTMDAEAIESCAWETLDQLIFATESQAAAQRALAEAQKVLDTAKHVTLATAELWRDRTQEAERAWAAVKNLK